MINTKSTKKIDYAALIRAIKSSITVTEYCNNVLGMNVIEGVRCVPTYRNGYNPTEFISYGDSYTDWGFPGGKRHYCDVIQLCADARHNGSRSEAIYELARSHINAERLSIIMNDSVTWEQHITTLERKINYWHSQLRPEDREYLHSRRITDETIERLKIGYCASTKRLITPYWHNGHVVYYSGRDVTGEWKVNKAHGKYTKMGIYHFYVENIPFGLHTLEPEHRALFPKNYTTSDERSFPYEDILCVLEGQVDAMSFEQEGFQVCSPVGGYFNEMQMPYFLSIARKIGKVYVCFDNDGAGTGFQLKMAQQLFQAKIPFVGCIVPKKIPGMTPKAEGQAVFTNGSNIVAGVNSSWLAGRINSGDIISDYRGNIFVIDKVVNDSSIILKTNYDGNTGLSPYEITQYIKDVSDYYTAGGNLADLVVNAEDGIIALARLIGDDYKKLKNFIKECARTVSKSDMLNLLEQCKGISQSIKAALLKEALRIPTEYDIVKEINGYTDENGKKYPAQYMLKYIENDGFYEYEHGCWVKKPDSKIKNYIAKVLGIYQRSDRINGAFNLLKLVCTVDLPNINLSNFFNRQPVVNFMNGILDLSAPDETIKDLLPHKPEYLSSLQVSQMYNRDAKCPKILKFLWDVLYYKNDEITRQKLDLLQEYLAYPLFPTNPIHKMLFLLGDGRNGKGTVLELARALYGDACVSFVNPAKFNQPFEAIYLKDSMLNICFDAEKDFSASQEIIKQVVAGESIMACYKFQNNIHFTPRAKLMTACNNFVKVNDLSRGFLSRCLFMNFHQSYEGRENFNLLNELKKELPGFFNWVLEGYMRLRKRIAEGKGFTIPEEHYETMISYEEHTSPLYMFYNEKLSDLINIQKENYDLHVMTTRFVYSEYMTWANANGYKVMNRGSFTHEFKKILRQKHPEMFKALGLAMTRKVNGVDEYDFTIIENIPSSNNIETANECEKDEKTPEEVKEAGVTAPNIAPANSPAPDYTQGTFTAEQIISDAKAGKCTMSTFLVKNNKGIDEFKPPVKTKKEAVDLLMFFTQNELNSDYEPIKDDNMPHMVECIMHAQPLGSSEFHGESFTEIEKGVILREVKALLKMKYDDIPSDEGQREWLIWQKAQRKYATIEKAVQVYINFVEGKRRDENFITKKLKGPHAPLEWHK